MNLSQLSEKRSKMLADAQALISSETVTAEQRSQFDTFMADIKAVDVDINRVSAIEQAQAETRSFATPARPNPSESADPVERAEVRNARVKASFRNFLATGAIETRDLTVATSGGIVIPQLFDAQVIEAQKSYGEIYNLVNVMKTNNGDPIKVALDDDTANGLTLVTTGTDAAETDPTLTSKLLQVSPYTTGAVKVGFDLLNDAGFDLEGFVRDKMGKRFYRGTSGLIYSGDGGNVAALDSYTAGITSSTIGVIKFADFTAALAALDPAYHPNAVWDMSNAALGSVLSLTDSNGRPLFLPGFGAADSGFVGTILGRPVKLVTQMPGIATGNYSVLFGDFKAAYTFRQVNPGISIMRLNERFAMGYEVGFVGFARVGGITTQASATIPPVVAIKIQ